MPAPLVLINTVGLTAPHLEFAPRLRQLVKQGWVRPMREVMPAVTSTVQATFLTGKDAQGHGIVGNGWLFRDTMEVRFWQQSNRLLQAPPIYASARKFNPQFRCAKIFWWFNQGADVAISVTPKPHYGADGNKLFDVLAYPQELGDHLKKTLAPFPFPTFWGPMAGLPSTQWIARCAAEVMKQPPVPDLTLVYLPHLDYETQRLGPEKCDWKKLIGELDDACAPLFDAADRAGAQVWIVNEYAYVQVDTPVFLNRWLRQKGWLTVRGGPFGEQIDFFESPAFAVCDHQLAHIYVKEPSRVQRLTDELVKLTGVTKFYAGSERATIGLDHPRAGEIVALAEPRSWFAYPFWLDDMQAPDYARTVDIHRKPGYDPCEMFFDPQLFWPKGRAMRRLLQKKLGMRTLFDVIPLDAHLVNGSHGLAVELKNRPILIGQGPAPEQADLAQTDVYRLLWNRLGLPQTAIA